MAHQIDRERACLKKIRDQLYFSKLGANGVCKLYDSINTDGYIRVSFNHPSTGTRTTCTIGRAVVMLKQGTFYIDKDLEASHLCHNKVCILGDHINFEPHSINNNRKACVNTGWCLGHGKFPDCLITLMM